MRFLIMALLAFSIWLVPASYEYADRERGYDATGGEMFTILVPLGLICASYAEEERRLARMKDREEKYKIKLKEMR